MYRQRFSAPDGLRRARAHADERGVTFMEVIITVAVLGILAALVIPMFSVTLKLADEARTTTSALYYSRFYIEQARAGTASAVGTDADGYPGACRTATTGANNTVVTESGTSANDGKAGSGFTVRRYIIQGCTREEEIVRDQMVIARLEAREGSAADGKVLFNMYYSIYVPGFYAESQ